MNIQNLSGQTLGQYELREILGFGGMGVAYKGYQKNLERFVAIKVLSPALANEPGYIERFYREAKTAAALEHAHIVPVYDYGVQGDMSYVVMRLLPGGSLEQRASQRVQTGKPLPSLGEVSNLLRQVASGLDYAHSKGVIHRDIKPGNIMFDDQGLAYIVDFGIAKLVESTTSFTASGVPMGTPIYMPPEQWKSEELTPAADQYALAVTVYTLITGGRLPFEATTPYGMMHKHINEPPAPAHTHRPDLPATLAPVLDRAMAKRPADRYPSVGAFALDFDMAIRGQTGELTNFFTTPVLMKHASGSMSNPFSSAAGSTNAQQPTTITVVQPVYKSPIMWVMAAALLVALGVLGFLLLNRDDDNPTEGRLSQADVQMTLTAAMVSAQRSPEEIETIQAEGFMRLTEISGATQTNEAQVNVRLTDIAAATGTKVAESEAQQAGTATAEGAAQASQTQAAADKTSTAESFTDTPAPSSTPRPSRTPTEAATEEAAAAVPAATEATTEEAATEEATPAEGDVRLIYDEDDLVILNVSGRTLDISNITFQQEGTQRDFSARLLNRSDISVPPYAMTTRTCYQIFTSSAEQTVPARSLCPITYFMIPFDANRYFWISEDEDATFTVTLGGETLATCEIAAGECTFALP